MKVRSPQTVVMIFLLPVMCQAQNLNDKILMNIAGRNIEAGEFMRMYNKSIEPGKKLDVDNYLGQYISFKLKVADAMKEGYDTTKAFKNELNGYRNQLSQSYLTDSQTKEILLQKAYKKYLIEINTWHILITCPGEASPEDTLKAWEKASGIRERIINGEPFEQVARGTSDDKSVTINGGNLGYISVFQMIMPFEDAAYNLKKDEISDPVRTPYGYHIIKVTDRRASKGRIKVAHIMKTLPPGAGEKEENKTISEINRIYRDLLAGSSFSEMAKKYSDHKESAVNGGELNWFGTGEIISDFSEAAFALKDTGTYSKPVRTNYGWHIIKLLDRRPPGTFEETRSFLESKINQSYLNSISKKSLVERLKKEYKFKINQVAYKWFVNNTDTLIIQGLTRYKRDSMPSGNIYTFTNQRFTIKEFATYIEKRKSMIITKDPLSFIDLSIETRATDQIISYENSILEKKYPDFRYLMNEFHDGMLLFEISGRKVWNKVREDTVGFRQYFEEHKNNYLTRKGIAAKVYLLKSPDGEKKLTTAFNKYSRKPDADKLLLERFNKKGDTLLYIKEGSWFKGDDPKMDSLKWVPGTSMSRMAGFPSIVVIYKIIEPVPLPFDEVQAEMMIGFQDYLETEWVRQLKGKYSVKIDTIVLETVKKRLTYE
jgi:peptidyl-prolyl cis-trans isomerase SurA